MERADIYIMGICNWEERERGWGIRGNGNGMVKREEGGERRGERGERGVGEQVWMPQGRSLKCLINCRVGRLVPCAASAPVCRG
jgi:hypothetical protein